ncbi:PREDICTED: autophagy-related protein 13a [Nelumbo nucifera]|uniref:Autophagy-related protein 13a n=1 Tax=Nelumbo nucifera TaxID=4432 RepID=A0A1U7ZBT1_NELNU|nr:PREDICTED: autophagy-related protein 13a [Nelumbo nucifera]XP_010251025.1 PREDICTED: autophagy-related protein 13a [Nelumbo nucifera]XP_010251034.1 PREDICTED: autophagy-related protein 13a [Nelumbo nucifera]
MALQGSSQSESGRHEQIISQFLLKSLHIILDSRIPSLSRHDLSGELTPVSRVRKSDKWFNLVLGERPASLEDLNFWHRNVMDPMIIDVILVHEGPSSSATDDLYTTSGVGVPVETVIERWVVQYEPSGTVPPQQVEAPASYKKMYQKAIVLLRSLYSIMRLLPAYRIFKQLSSLNQTYNFDLIYKVSSFGELLSRAEEKVMKQYSFAPVEAPSGRLSISLTYQPTLSGFNLAPSTPVPPNIITDYVGSPAADPLKVFPCTDKGIPATSFSFRRIHSPTSVPFQRPHSWSSGIHRVAPFKQNHPLCGSPPAHHTPPVPCHSSSPPDIYGYRIQGYRPPSHKKGISFDEHQLSPPFLPSPSPSPPTYFSSGNPFRTAQGTETAPVSIPLPNMGRNSRYTIPNSSDPNRHSLPPMSPRSTRLDLSSQESPSSGSRSFRKTDALRSGELSGFAQLYSGQKIFKDSKDDSGRFSGIVSSSGSPRVGFSRSSSRLSFQDDLDDCDFSYPFVVDDVDTSDSQTRTPEGKEASESTSQAFPSARKSQDAAVGVLVHMLRTAPPLRQDYSCYSSQTSKSEFEGEVGSGSGFCVPRKTTDALEELKSYREMKDLLLSQSGTRVIKKEEAKPTAFVG